MINCIFVRSRKEMESCMETLSKPSLLITIRDVGAKPIRVTSPHIHEITYLEFEDWDKENDGQIVISDSDAKRIVNLVLRNHIKEEEFDLYVNCEAGQSRSAGVAAAISKVLFDDDEIFFRTKHPNMLCYRKVYDALMKEVQG